MELTTKRHLSHAVVSITLGCYVIYKGWLVEDFDFSEADVFSKLFILGMSIFIGFMFSGLLIALPYAATGACFNKYPTDDLSNIILMACFNTLTFLICLDLFLTN